MAVLTKSLVSGMTREQYEGIAAVLIDGPPPGSSPTTPGSKTAG